MNIKGKLKSLLYHQKKRGGICHPISNKNGRNQIEYLYQYILIGLCIGSVLFIAIKLITNSIDNTKIKEQQKIMEELKKEIIVDTKEIYKTKEDMKNTMILEAKIMPEYQSLYEENSELIGWLMIDDTVIDYPVMQTLNDESYYLNTDFNKEKNVNGSLILDTDSIMGIGCKDNNYAEVGGVPPSTNLIIHGHTMKSGMMFGELNKYANQNYGTEHANIYFDSLYEKREYKVIAVFYSQVYMNSDDVFKYYKFFQANSKEEFDDWYENIKEMSLYDTEVTAEYGDEFITLSCCSYQVADGRFVVVGKRIK